MAAPRRFSFFGVLSAPAWSWVVPPPDSVPVGVRLEKNAWGLMKWDRGKCVIAIVIMTIEELQLQLQSNACEAVHAGGQPVAARGPAEEGVPVEQFAVHPLVCRGGLVVVVVVDVVVVVGWRVAGMVSRDTRRGG